MTKSKITIFDHDGKPLTEIIAATTRSWALDDIGRCNFEISTEDPKCKKRYLNFGNFILIQHIPSTDESGNARGKLPDWVGIILAPRIWNYGKVTVTAYSAEALMQYRSPPFASFQGVAWGGIMLQFLNYANQCAQGGYQIQPGEIYIGDTGSTPWWDIYVDLFTHVQNVSYFKGGSTEDFDITYKLVGGNLQLLFNWYSHKGVVCPIQLDSTNTELASPLLQEQGIIANDENGDNSSSTMGTRLTANAKNQDSISDYGLLQKKFVMQGASQYVLQSAANNLVTINGRPIETVTPSVLDIGKLFDWMNTGNTVKMAYTDVGFDGDNFGITASGRILVMEYDDKQNVCRLVIEAFHE